MSYDRSYEDAQNSDTKQSTQSSSNASKPLSQPADQSDSSSLVKTSGKKPGEYAPPEGQDSGTAWQESQQMGRTGHDRTVQNPLRNP